MNSPRPKSNRTRKIFQHFNRLSGNRRFVQVFQLLLIVGIVFSGAESIYLGQQLATTRERSGVYLRELNFLQREAGGFTFYEASSYVQVDSPLIRQKTEELRTPQKIFDFVDKEVSYYGSTFEDNIYAENVLTTKNSNCLGQANLLCALLRDFGFSSEHCHITYGSITKNGKEGSHAWVELYYNNTWIVLDPTELTGHYGFNFWTEEDFYRRFHILPIFEYNDTYSRFIPY